MIMSITQPTIIIYNLILNRIIQGMKHYINMNNNNKPICPHVKWAQRKDKLFITIEVENLNKPDIVLKKEGFLKFK